MRRLGATGNYHWDTSMELRMNGPLQWRTRNRPLVELRADLAMPDRTLPIGAGAGTTGFLNELAWHEAYAPVFVPGRRTERSLPARSAEPDRWAVDGR
jgi:hypothetical protein